MTFTFSIINNGVYVPLICECSYDYCTDTGPSACLTKAMVADWNLVGLMTNEEREEIEAFYLDNVYEIEQRATHHSIEDAKQRGEIKQ